MNKAKSYSLTKIELKLPIHIGVKKNRRNTLSKEKIMVLGYGRLNKMSIYEPKALRNASKISSSLPANRLNESLRNLFGGRYFQGSAHPF